VIVLSAVFLGERMYFWQWVGFALIMSGILLVTWRVHRSNVNADNIAKGVGFGVLAMLAMAIGIVMVKEVLETRSFLWTVELRLVGGLAGLLVYATLSRQWSKVLQNFTQPQPWGTIILASFLATYLAVILWLAGYRLIDASIASVLNETNSAFVVLLAWLMLGEELNARKIAGITLTLSGVMIMIIN
jgi:drug/metabolite transporter (DMT)-like permease